MFSVLNYKCIEVENKEVFYGKKWKGFIYNLFKK